MQFWDHFERVYVINLPARADRRREVDAELRMVGLGLHHPRVQLFRAIRPDTPGGFPSIGARGCFLSHLGVLREAGDAGHRSIAILEDDVSFVRGFDVQAARVSSTLSATDWDVFYGGHRLGVSPAPSRVEVLRPTQGVETTHFVALRGARTIVAAAEYLDAQLRRPPGDPAGGPMHVDGSYSWFRSQNPLLCTLAAAPALAHQRSSASDVAVSAGWRNLPPARAAMRPLRWLKRMVQRA